MEKFAVKLTITSSWTENISYEWFITTSEFAKDDWIKLKLEEQKKINSGDSQYQSRRIYDFQTYTVNDLLDQPLSELDGLTLGDLMKLITD